MRDRQPTGPVNHHLPSPDSRLPPPALPAHPGWSASHAKTRRRPPPPRVAVPRDPDFAACLQQLTQHERDVLRARAAGLVLTAIADRYGISLQTVKNCFAHIFAKLQLDGPGKSARACYLLGRYDANAGPARQPAGDRTLER